jgi:hypothetical protein
MKLSEKFAQARDNLLFNTELGASYGPSKAVQDEMAKNGWSFRSEVVTTIQAPAIVETFHPILNGVEIKPSVKGRYTPEWERYQTERMTAVYNTHGRSVPDVLPVPKAGTRTPEQLLWRELRLLALNR